MDEVLKVLGAITLTILMLCGLAALMAYPTKWMVNYLFTAGVLTAIFGVAKISIWQAFWLNWLCAGLFKSSTTSKK